MTQLHSTPQKILGLLKRHHRLSVSHLKEMLDISDMAVRKHISKLEKEQSIKSIQVKQQIGRPVMHYQLSHKGENHFPRNYSGMTLEFLQDLEEMHGPETIDTLFQKREDRLQEKYQQKVAEHPSLKERVQVLQQIQNKHGYMAESHQIDDGKFEFTEYNCPIYRVADQYKQACQCELSLFKRVLGVDKIKRTSCISEGDHCCKYIIQTDET